MPNIALSDSRIKGLGPRPCAYDIRDSRLKLVFDSRKLKRVGSQ